jgi:hypothetical protein
MANEGWEPNLFLLNVFANTALIDCGLSKVARAPLKFFFVFFVNFKTQTLVPVKILQMKKNTLVNNIIKISHITKN